MSTKVESNKKYAEAIRGINVLGLFGFIKEVYYSYKGHNRVAHSIYEAQHRLFTLYQGT